MSKDEIVDELICLLKEDDMMILKEYQRAVCSDCSGGVKIKAVFKSPTAFKIQQLIKRYEQYR